MLQLKSIVALSVLFFPAVGALAAPTTAETARFADRIKSADTNNDHAVSRSELVAFRASKFSALDRDANGILTTNDLPSFARNSSRATEYNAMLKEFDLNRDGKVSRDEFVHGPTVMFDSLDLNHNGIIEPNEFKMAK